MKLIGLSRASREFNANFKLEYGWITFRLAFHIGGLIYRAGYETEAEGMQFSGIIEIAMDGLNLVCKIEVRQLSLLLDIRIRSISAIAEPESGVDLSRGIPSSFRHSFAGESHVCESAKFHRNGAEEHEVKRDNRPRPFEPACQETRQLDG